MFLNKVQLIGRLGRDPEVRSFQNGGKVANLRVATTKKWKDRNTGEQREQTQWHTVAIFAEALCGIVERFAFKGQLIYIEGALETRKWQDQSGQDRYSTEVVLRPYDGEIKFLSFRDDNSGGGGSSGGGYDNYGGDGRSNRDIDDEIPF